MKEDLKNKKGCNKAQPVRAGAVPNGSCHCHNQETATGLFPQLGFPSAPGSWRGADRQTQGLGGARRPRVTAPRAAGKASLSRVALPLRTSSTHRASWSSLRNQTGRVS